MCDQCPTPQMTWCSPGKKTILWRWMRPSNCLSTSSYSTLWGTVLRPTPLELWVDFEILVSRIEDKKRKVAQTSVACAGNFTCIEVIFTLKRRLGYYLFHTYIPTCLIVIMSWISFWIRPEAVPARVTLCVTSLLTLSTQHAQSQKSLPPVSYIKAIDIFMSSCTVFVFSSLMEYAFVNILMGDSGDDDIRLRNMVVKLPSCPRVPNGSRTSLLQRRSRANLVDKVSRIVFPLSFLILNAIYWTYYLSGG
ncbi:hypothetical protein LAZ67_11003206 [Cordylochernes scorpioides]|uniref:Neurotransmitter-gated ion-channel transmembrane domain-containing protein n=1 Tax=Cordylochernes scorpioides TaxID=51811 RepID=A0ABY6L2E7_9ARAC|nr:hypothetical protein LAZ67_11003206 [Cordylochernes scorpioides]